jgi:two-component system, cell cycle sensor histidine kinase and response regulator CckA
MSPDKKNAPHKSAAAGNTRSVGGDEATVRTLLDASHDAAVLIDTSGIIVDLNETFAQRVGRTVGELRGTNIWSTVSGDAAQRRRERVDEAVRTRKPVFFGDERNGRIIDHRFFPVVGPGDVVRLVAIYSSDITDRRRAEEERRSSEERYRLLVETSPDLIHVQCEGKFVYVNPASVRRYGARSSDEIVGREILDLIHPDYRDVVRERIRHSRDDMADAPLMEERYLRLDGTSFDVEVVASTFVLDGKPAAQVIARDITDRKRAEQALRDSEQQLRLITDNLPVLISYVDAEYRYVFNNKLYEKRYGRSLDDLRGRRLREVMGEQPFAEIEPYLKRAMAGETVTYEHIRRYVDVGERTLSSTVVPHRGEDGKVKGLFALVTDITDRIKMEESLNKSQRIESLGLLAGGIAHDFNNLLAGLFGYVDMARDCAETGNLSGALENVNGALGVFGRTRDLTRQLLTFAKGGVPLKKAMGIQSLLTDAVRFALSGSTVTPHIDVADDLWPCDVDPGQISQAIDNILINARQAMPSGGSIRVSAVNLPVTSDLPQGLARRDYVVITIADHGAGIAKEHLPRIFDPFWTTKQEGSGLGLATCYSIVKRHDGHISVESELGKGATFRVYLPASTVPVGTERVAPPRDLRGHGKVMIMDDEKHIREVARRMLSSMGYAVVCAGTGQEAVEAYRAALAESAPFDAVILDLTVPGGMGGKETLDVLRGLDPSVAAIASSGYSHDPVMADPPSFGFSAAIAKPYRMGDLGQIVQTIMAGKPSSV